MNAGEPKNDFERLARLQDARAQDDATLKARRACDKAVPVKAGEPNEHLRYAVTPDDIVAIRGRYFEGAELRNRAAEAVLQRAIANGPALAKRLAELDRG